MTFPTECKNQSHVPKHQPDLDTITFDMMKHVSDGRVRFYIICKGIKLSESVTSSLPFGMQEMHTALHSPFALEVTDSASKMAQKIVKFGTLCPKPGILTGKCW
jgi:hypothetical protein